MNIFKLYYSMFLVIAESRFPKTEVPNRINLITYLRKIMLDIKEIQEKAKKEVEEEIKNKAKDRLKAQYKAVETAKQVYANEQRKLDDLIAAISEGN